MKVLLIGGRGQLATSLRGALADDEVVAATHGELEICDRAQVDEFVDRLRPDIVVNPAAIRKPDECEANPEKAWAVNALGPRNLALACERVGAKLVHISTDNVFDGTASAPYLEGDRTNPVNVYGITKLAAEQFVKEIAGRHLIVRTSALFGGARDPGRPTNFVMTLLQRDASGLDTHVVTDQQVSPSYTEDVARKIAWLVRKEVEGICHVANAGDCSWHEFAEAVFELAGLRSRLISMTTDKLGSPARRLKYAVLGNGVLARLGADDMPLWRDALERYLRELGARSPAAVS